MMTIFCSPYKAEYSKLPRLYSVPSYYYYYCSCVRVTGVRGLQDTMTTTTSIPKCIASVRFRSPEKFCIKTLRHNMFIVARILLPRYGQRRGDVELLLFFENIYFVVLVLISFYASKFCYSSVFLHWHII